MYSSAGSSGNNDTEIANDMTILWIVLAFVAGSIFGAVTMSLLAAGNRAEQDSWGGGKTT